MRKNASCCDLPSFMQMLLGAAGWYRKYLIMISREEKSLILDCDSGDRAVWLIFRNVRTLKLL